MQRPITLAIAIACLVAAFAFGASPAEERGREIAAEWDKRDTGWNDITSELEMILRNRGGQESKRVLRNKTLEVTSDGDKLLVSFDEPRDVKGTNFLSFTHIEGPDDQWLYLPALKRIKRIASNNKSGPFMGSEFAYEDLASQEVDKYKYEFVGEEEANGRPAYRVKRIPLDPRSGYTSHEVWFDKETYRPEQVQFFDRKSSLLKTLTYKGYKQYADKYWRPDEMYMENHQTGKSTRLLFHNYEFQSGLTARDFDRASLARAR